MDKKFTKECAYCSESFQTSNFRKKYCSNTCRTYASQERQGKLNPVQQAIKSGEISTASSDRHSPTKNGEEIITDLLLDHLKQLFATDNENGFFWAGEVYRDIYLGIDHFSVLPSGNFLFCTTSEEVAKWLKEKYGGSKIVKGVTREEIIEDVPLPIRDGIFSKPEQNGTRKDRYTTYKTILPREKVIRVSNLDTVFI